MGGDLVFTWFHRNLSPPVGNSPNGGDCKEKRLSKCPRNSDFGILVSFAQMKIQS